VTFHQKSRFSRCFVDLLSETEGDREKNSIVAAISK
jgi:hypothetical protein